MRVARTIPETRATLAALPQPTALVPTMGALHEGHLTLLREARRFAGPDGTLVMSLFVNPTQFGAGEDYTRYPRDEARDLALARSEGVDLVFAPSVEEMYPDGSATTVRVAGPLSESFEGADRPGHFDGVATVVAKLFSIVRPDAAFFGRKDAQQLALIRRLTADLDLGVTISGVETVREDDGLALSSRNAYLDGRGRAAAARLFAALRAGRAAAARPGATPDDVAGVVLAALNEGVDDGDEAVRFAPDYVAVVDPDTFVPETSLRERSLIIAAARLGNTRLIDNLPAHEDVSTGNHKTDERYHADDAARATRRDSTTDAARATRRERADDTVKAYRRDRTDDHARADERDGDGEEDVPQPAMRAAQEG